MRAFEEIKAVIDRFMARFAASRRASKFTCGDCDRSERCGLPPHADCAAKAAQLAQEDGDHKRGYAYYKAVWPR
ncbi:MAG: hypothetical protein WDN48_01395 [Pseudolabrys sp.]